MLPWRRHRKAQQRFDPRAQADTWQVTSLLLDYPDEALLQRMPVLRQIVDGLPEQAAVPLRRFCDHVEAVVSDRSLGLGALQTDYVDTFDVTRKCALHLTYFLHGDTRNRGVALVRFKQLYREHGALLTDEDAELPDHLCVVLEFGATAAPEAAWKLLNDHRVGIELLRRALDHRDSPWLDVVQAVRATLPELDDDDEVALAKLIAQGPPQESVGLDDSPYLIPTDAEPSPATPAPTQLGSTIPVGAPR